MCPRRSGPTAVGRRRVLEAIGTLGVAGLAGCTLGGDGTPPATGTATVDPGQSPSTHVDTTASDPPPTPTSDPSPTPTSIVTTTEGTCVRPLPDGTPPLLSFDGDGVVVAGETNTVPATLANAYLFEVVSVSADLDVPDDWTIEGASERTVNAIPSEESREIAWAVTVPESADGEYELAATHAYATCSDSVELRVTHSVVASET
jgi:hypothetical protein